MLPQQLFEQALHITNPWFIKGLENNNFPF